MIKNFIKKHEIEYYEEASLKRYNTYRVDAKCKYLIIPKDKYELIELLKYLKEQKQDYIILGNGSNIILAKDYYDKPIILLHKLKNITINDDIVEVGAGYSLQKLAIDVSTKGLSGLEFACGIPGLIGASIAMNAGAYKSSMQDVVETVEVINKKLELVSMSKNDLEFEYRNSIFKKNKNYIIVGATLKLSHGDKEEILETISRRRVKRLETQPLDMPSAGSVFRNPEGYFAGKLIEDCNLKGYNVNGAEVSQKHANFIINKGTATGKDIIKIIDVIKEKIKTEYNIDLIIEQIIID